MFDKIREKMKSPGEILSLNEADGEKAIGKLALVQAHREKEAALAHVESNPAAKEKLSEGDLEDLRSEVEAGHTEFGTDVGEIKLGLPVQNDQFHIPDVEPTVTKVEDSAEETVEAKDDEKIAA